MSENGSEINVPACCAQAVEADFRGKFPMEPSLEEDWLRTYLLTLARKWGEITEAATQGTFFRTVPRKDFFDAQTYLVQCPEGHRVRVVLLGSRVYYLAWRINLICSTYWTSKETAEGIIGFTGDDIWPLDIHVEQLHTAIQTYLDDTFLSNHGFEDLKNFVTEGQQEAVIHQMYIGEFALLFLFLHEMNHAILDDLGPERKMHFDVPATTPGLSEKRKERWGEELSHDANAAFMAWLSALMVFQKKFKLPAGDAKTQAGSLVFTGADLALNTLQFVEEQWFGKVSIEEAAFLNEFRKHPPSQERRNKLSLAAFSAVTGKPLEDLWNRQGGKSWASVASNVASQMKIRDRLFSGYEARYGTGKGENL